MFQCTVKYTKVLELESIRLNGISFIDIILIGIVSQNEKGKIVNSDECVINIA